MISLTVIAVHAGHTVSAGFYLHDVDHGTSSLQSNSDHPAAAGPQHPQQVRRQRLQTNAAQHQALHSGNRFGRVLQQSRQTGRTGRQATVLLADGRSQTPGGGHRHDRFRLVRIRQALGHPS